MEGVWASEVSLSLPPSLYPNTVFHPAVALDSECLFSVFNFSSSPSFLPSFRDCGWIGGGGRASGGSCVTILLCIIQKIMDGEVMIEMRVFTQRSNEDSDLAHISYHRKKILGQS